MCHMNHLLSRDFDRLLFGDLDSLFHPIFDPVSSLPLCSSCFRLDMFWEDERLECSLSTSAMTLSAALCLCPFPEGVPVPLEVLDFVADTKSIASLGALDLSCSFDFVIRFCAARSSST